MKYALEFDLDDPRRTAEHARIIRAKPFLEKIYRRWYGMILAELKSVPPGKIVEIGSGGGFLKEIFPQVITSDVMPVAGCDMTFSATELPFEAGELAAILMVNVLHHLPDPEAFFNRAGSQLRPGGRIVMIETANSPVSRLIYTRFHHEDFDVRAGWTLKGGGPLSVSNQALPWIIFERDRAKFDTLFPVLHVEKISYHTPLLYLLSGGLSHTALVPSWTFGFFAGLERVFSFANRMTGLFETIVISRK